MREFKDDYYSENIRRALVTLFDDEGFTAVCFDHFRQAYYKFADGMTRTKKIQHLLDYCDRNGEMAALVTLLRQQKARRIDEFEPLKRTGFQVVTPALKLAWCYVPAGEFLMGSAADDPDAWDDEKPQHSVTVPAFYLGRYPITNQQYQVFVEATGYKQPDHWQDGQIPVGEERHPVRFVSWEDAVAFCQWAAGACGVPIRLLTEAEWEKGARGAAGARYPWGNEWQPGYSNSDNVVKGTTGIGRYAQGVSPYGAHDMMGNVWEWTSSIYRPYPYQADDGREGLNPEEKRVIRGGCWWSSVTVSHAAVRPDGDAGLREYCGFRVGWGRELGRMKDEL